MSKNTVTKSTPKTKLWSNIVILFGGMVGLVASFTLVLDELELAANPDAILNCNISTALNCSTVMQTWQASLFGFPNMIIGLSAFSVIITFAVASLMGAQFPKLFRRLLNIGAALGLIFAYWMFFDSLYVIQVLCPWCLTVTTSMTLIFAAVTRQSAQDKLLGLPKNLADKVAKFYKNNFDIAVVIGWLALLVALAIIKFGSSLYI